MLVLIVLLGTLQFCSTADVSNATLPDEIMPVLNLCDFSSHNDFTTGLEDLLREDITRALLFSLEYSAGNSSEFLESLGSAEYTFLQILYGLISGDEAYTKLAAQLAYKLESKGVEKMSVWFNNSFRFKKENLYDSLLNYVEWNVENITSPDLTRLMVLIAKQNSLDEILALQEEQKAIDFLIRHGFVIEKPNKRNIEDNGIDPPLHGAAERGDLPSVRDLINRGAKINCTGKDGSTPLHKAAYWGHLSIVRELLGLGASPNCTDRSGETPLCWAVNGRKLSVIDELLRKGACVNCADNDGRTPLHSAAWWGNLPIAKELVGFGADVNSRDVDGRTPLQVAVQMYNVQVAKLLRSLGGVI